MLYDSKGEIIEGTIGTTVAMKETSSYWGDGDTTYGVTGTYLTAEGEYKSVACGKNTWWSYDPNTIKTAGVIDGDVARYVAHLAILKAQYEREKALKETYEVKRGAFAWVARSSRKHLNKFGFVFWVGQNQWGTSAGIEAPDGERFFVPEHYLVGMPVPDELIPNAS